MKRQLVLAFGMFILAVMGALMLRPSPAVRFEADLAALEPEEALKMLETADPAIARSVNIGLIHARLSLDSGNTDGVRDALSTLESTQGLEDLISDQLSEAAMLDGDLPGAIAHLQDAYRSKPTAERRLKLGAWLRLERKPVEELALLRSVPASGLTTGEAERLAQLLLQAGSHAELERTYRLLAANPEREDDTFRRRLIDLLTESGQAREAVTTTLRWFDEGRREPGPIEIAVPSLISRGAIDEAHYLATVYMQAAHDPSHAMIPLFARSGHIAIALDLQDQWLAGAKTIPPEAWATLIDIANTTGDVRGVRAALSKASFDGADAALLGDALMQLLRYQGVAALTPYRTRFTPGFLQNAPLIGAAVMQGQGRQDAALDYLMQAARPELEDWEVQIWLMLAAQLSHGPVYKSLLLTGTGDPRIDGALGAGIISESEPIPGQ